MANGVALVGQHPYAPLVGAAAAITFHLLLAIGVSRIPPGILGRDRAAPVEVDLVAPKPSDPAPPPPLSAPAPPPPMESAPKHYVRRPALPKAPPPVPNREDKPPPPTDTPPTPVFGVTPDSVIAGESAVAVPVGNTLMTKDRTVAKVAPPPPTPTFSPVDEESISRWPKVRVENKPHYPEIARRLGIEGRVPIKLGIDRNGNVKSARVVQKQGYGLDEAAMEAAWRTKFEPALDFQGKPVDFSIIYEFKFNMGDR